MIRTDDTQQEVGFIKTKHNGQMANIGHIMTKENGQMVKIFEQGFTREQEATALPMETNTKTVGKDLKQYLIYGNSEQDGTPTPDNPIEVESVGDRTKNLFSPDILSQFTGDLSYLSSIEPTNDGFKVTLSKNTSTSYTYLLKLPLEDNIVYSCDNTDGTIEKTGTEWRFFFAKYQAKTAGTVIYFHKVQKEKGTTPTPYEPYGYKIPVEVKTKNLFNKEWEPYQAYIWASQNWSYAADSTSWRIPCKPNTDYTISCSETSAIFRIATINSEDTPSPTKTDLPITSKYNNNSPLSKTITTGADDKYIIIQISTSTAGIVKSAIQVEEGSTATSYVPYFNETTNIILDEPLRKIGDYADYIDYKNQKVVRNIGAKNLNGTESWSYFSSYNCYYVRILDMMVLSGYPYGLCNRFKSGQRTVQGCIQFGGGNNYIYIHDDNEYADVTLFKNWLISNNTGIVYPLATPTEESITLPSISTVKGEKSIFDILTKVEPSKLKITYKGE